MTRKKRWTIPIIIIACLAGAMALYRHTGAGRPGRFFSKPNAVVRPERIVSLAPNLTEVLFALGLGDRVVAVSNNCDYPAGAAEKAKVGTFWQPNTEAIIAAKPDLVVTLWFEQQRAVADTLDRTGIDVLTFRIDKIPELYAAIEKIGKAVGSERRAELLNDNIVGRLNALRRKFATSKKVKVLWVVQTEPLRLAGRNTFVNQLIELAGGKNAIAPTIQQYPPVGTEELLAGGAEVIIQSAMGTGDIDRQQTAAEAFWGRFASLPAVKNKRIYVIRADTMLRLGPRLPEGAETIARYLHPDLTE